MEYYSSLDASQLDSETPTLFEIISTSQLEALLSPSLRYILVYYTNRYPSYLIRVSNKFDEINLVVRSFIEWYFLKYWQGSFTENFYGLKRVSQTSLAKNRFNGSKLAQLVPSMVEERRMLSRRQMVVSIFEVTGAAYLSEKFNYWYELWYPKYITKQLEPQDPENREEVLKCNLKKRFVEWYPTFQAAYRAGNFIAVLSYLAGLTKSPSLLTFFFRINYSRLTQHDYAKNEPPLGKGQNNPIPLNRPLNTIEYILRLLKRNVARPIFKLIKVLLGTFFPVSIFTLKFLEWWNNSSFGDRIAKNSGKYLSIVPPPPSLISRNARRVKNVKKIFKSSENCPLCKGPINNPAIIETGYVFCYTCIYNYLKDSHRIVAEVIKAKTSENKDDFFDDSDAEDSGNEHEFDYKDATVQKDGSDENNMTEAYDLNKGGRCPITGKKLLGCKWNSLKGEWDAEGIRRIII